MCSVLPSADGVRAVSGNSCPERGYDAYDIRRDLSPRRPYSRRSSMGLMVRVFLRFWCLWWNSSGRLSCGSSTTLAEPPPGPGTGRGRGDTEK